jgi:hypothetical protein
VTHALAVPAATGLAFAMAADGPALLFAKGAGKVTPAEQRAIFAVLDLKLAPDGKGVLDTTCEQPAGAFIKNAAGKYEANVGFPGVTADPKPEKSQGYPDLLIGGPGFCFPVWRWNGKAYDFSRDEPQEPGGCDNR